MNEKCKWGMYSRFDDGVWGTSCGAEWEFTYGGTPEEHGMKYCPYCGKEVEESYAQATLEKLHKVVCPDCIAAARSRKKNATVKA